MSENKPESFLSVIRMRNESLVQKFLSINSVDSINCHQDEWYPLHEAFDLGEFAIAKQIVEFASKHGINVLHKWDQNLIASKILVQSSLQV